MLRLISSSRRVADLVSAMALSFILVSLNLSAPVAAQSGTMVRVIPPTQMSSPGATVGVDVRIDDVADLYGAEIHLQFDPTLLAVQDANATQPGTQVVLGALLTSGGTGTYSVGANSADNAAGTVDVANTLMNPAPPVSGSGVFAHINFTALTSGVSSVQIASAILADRNANRLPFALQSGTIDVAGTASTTPPAEVPEADTLFLFGTGGGGLIGFVLLKWRSRGIK